MQTLATVTTENSSAGIAFEDRSTLNTILHSLTSKLNVIYATPGCTSIIGPTVSEKGVVLVMDDDEMIRDVARGLFAYLRFGCDPAASGEEGVALYASALAQGRPYRCVIADLQVRGGMGGQEMASKILELDPAAKILACSGETNQVMRHYAEHGFFGTLEKPYSIQKLSTALQQTLDQP